VERRVWKHPASKQLDNDMDHGNRFPFLSVLLLPVFLAGCVGFEPWEDPWFTRVSIPMDTPVHPSLWKKAEGLPAGAAKRRIQSTLGFGTRPVGRIEGIKLSSRELERIRGIQVSLPFCAPVYLALSGKMDFPEGDPSMASISWTPLRVGAGQSCEKGRGIFSRLSGFSLPLLFTRVSCRSRQEDLGVDLLSFLYPVGPFFADVQLGSCLHGPENVTQDEWCFFPLSVPGSLVWMDHGKELKSRNRLQKQVSHGPLGGWLGYRHFHEKAAGDSRSTSLMMGGILWFDRMRARSGSRSSVHGPLWGAFGWKTREESLYVNILWIPVKVSG